MWASNSRFAALMTTGTPTVGAGAVPQGSCACEVRAARSTWACCSSGWWAAQRPCAASQSTRRRYRAHAHNDYAHARPLLDALDHGFLSVEADIHLVEGDLLVAHDRFQVQPQRTLRALYLDPLHERVVAHGGHVYAGSDAALLLLIDIKSEAAETCAALHKQLAGYQDMLTSYDDDGTHAKAVTVVISGNRPVEALTKQTVRYAAYDGRLNELGRDIPPSLMPLVSDNWRRQFRWNGVGAQPAKEQQKLRDLVTKTHEEGRRLRFWGTPDNAAVWQVLYDAGVDLINTDDLDGLAAFLRERA